MFFGWKGLVAATLLLAARESLVSASLKDVDNRTEDLPQLIVDCVRVPWVTGHDWLIYSAEYDRVEKVRELVRGIESGETWAVQMLDTLLKIERETPKKNITVFGINDENYADTQDNRCPMISSDDIFSINRGSHGLPTSARYTPLNKKFKAALLSKFDYGTLGNKDFTTGEIATIIFFATIVTFMITCTICDIVKRNHGGKNLSAAVNTLSKFSLYTNALAILNTEVTPDTMPAMHGIRCLAFCSVIAGHRYLLSAMVHGSERLTLLEYLEARNSGIGMCMIMALYSVDTFFIISGFFITYLFLKMLASGKKINLPLMYLHRYLKATPCIAVVVLFSGVLLHRLKSGPLWEAIIYKTANHCSKDWWFHLFHIQNLLENGFLCTPHSWYLACDMQLFWISPLILYPLHRSPKLGLRLLTLLFVASIAIPAIILGINRYSNALLRLDRETVFQMEYYQNYYIPTYCRATPYLVGMFLGYDIAKKKRRLSQVNVAINWLLAVVLLLLGSWLTIYGSATNFAYDLSTEIAVTVLVRSFWAIAVAWIIYACTQGYGGPVTKFLSMPIFFPLSRLAFCIYLVHPGVVAARMMSTQNPGEYSEFEKFCVVSSDLVASAAVAFVFSLFIESPVIVLIKILTSRGRKPEQITPSQNQKSKEEAIKSE